MNRRRLKIAKYLLIDDDEEDILELLALMPNKRKKTHEMILNRDSEGAFNILIKKYLLTTEDLFVKYFRVTPYLFYMILENISAEITTTPCNRNPNPISAEQKLCLTLR